MVTQRWRAGVLPVFLQRRVRMFEGYFHHERRRLQCLVVRGHRRVRRVLRTGVVARRQQDRLRRIVAGNPRRVYRGRANWLVSVPRSSVAGSPRLQSELAAVTEQKKKEKRTMTSANRKTLSVAAFCALLLFAASAHGQQFSEWSTPINLGPV